VIKLSINGSDPIIVRHRRKNGGAIECGDSFYFVFFKQKNQIKLKIIENEKHITAIRIDRRRDETIFRHK
jgi:hypothetical protein